MASAQPIPEWLQRNFDVEYPHWVEVEKSDHGGEIIDGGHMPSLKVRKMLQNQATAYRFVFEEPFSWAIFTINDETGEFHLQSDWGNWQYRWNIDSLGEAKNSPRPLTKFLSRQRHGDYVTDKFHYGRDDRDRFSGDGTKEAIKRRLLERRRELSISREEARKVWDQLHDDYIDWDDGRSFLYSIEDYSELSAFFDEEDGTYCLMTKEPTFTYTLLRYKLLPFFFEYLRREVMK